MSLYVQGICVGIRDEVQVYTKDGKEQSFDVRTIAIAAEDGLGDPVVVDVPKKFMNSFVAFKPYRFPVAHSARVAKGGGAVSRLRIPDNSIITPLAAQGAAGGK